MSATTVNGYLSNVIVDLKKIKFLSVLVITYFLIIYIYWDDRPVIVTRSTQMTRPQSKRQGRPRGARGRPTLDAQVKG